MAVKRRVIWLSDEEWAKVGERAEAFALSRSAYLGKLIEWRQPDSTFVTTGQRGMEPPRDSDERILAMNRTAIAIPLHPDENPMRQFRPAPKPGRK